MAKTLPLAIATEISEHFDDLRDSSDENTIRLEDGSVFTIEKGIPARPFSTGSCCSVVVAGREFFVLVQEIKQ